MTAARGPVEIAGVGADAVARLRDLAPDLRWHDRSPFLGASARPALPWLRYEHRDHRAEADGRSPAAPPVARRVPAGRAGMSFAPEDGTGARSWAVTRGLRLLAPVRAAVAVAADKIDAMPLFDRAGVAVPESRVVLADPADAASCWAAGGGRPVVVQRRVNNLTGKGTRLVTGAVELRAALDEWRGERLRVSALVPGIPLTVSGCVTGGGTAASAVSHQLVGLPELTPYWGAHCGNQLVADDELPAGVGARCGQVCERVGDQLRALGYRGAFGLDLVATPDGAVLAIEINPRFQTVVSLVQAQEIAAGLLPMLGAHALASLLPSVPVRRVRAACLPLSQLVVPAAAHGVLGAVPESGCYRLDAGRLRPRPTRRLADLRPGEALLWRHARPGDRVRPGEELVLVQLPHRVAEVGDRPALTPDARAWVDATRRAVTVVAGPPP
ncbi:ATP-grasp domain-containing protein [Saccharothrix saharensis]|uniref:ATP-grasp domain-containing protein n=1 Tax=Saccharothrix saharensis TaxID=571190 RepID=A0A543J8J4_9PSEU|nr:ATP-grasp domain-containing protein [Saccharothrix saharensis]TQM79138.1 ATP-grasp domain-containing protein [Saccharothrix saharensis]